MTKKEMKKHLEDAWKEIFDVKEVNDENDFFGDGGDSIKAVQLTYWLLQKGVQLDLGDIFAFPTLGEMAEKLKETTPMYVPEALLTKDIAMEEMYKQVMNGEIEIPKEQILKAISLMTTDNAEKIKEQVGKEKLKSMFKKADIKETDLKGTEFEGII